MLASLLLVPVALLPALQEPDHARDPREARLLSRREAELEEAATARETAYDALVDAYAHAESLWEAEGIPREDEWGPTLNAWRAAEGLSPAAWPERRTALREAGNFHDWWNGALYHHSPEAAAYAEAVAALEEAFQRVERLRHPERFAEGFDQTPTGMVLVPEGRYPIGPHFGRIDGFPDSEEQNIVRLDAFYLDRSEVSCADYWKFLLSQPQGLQAQHLPLDWEVDEQDHPILPEGLAEAPVVGISWNSAASYARWAGKRLPTEQEWEAAAAGTEGRRYARQLGFDAQRINCLATGLRGVRAVRDFAEDRTPLGILGLAGNAAEWTGDLWSVPLGEGRRARAEERPADGVEAVVRGGSYLSSAEGCRNTYRALYPALGRAYRHIGFRCAQDLP